MQVRAFLKIYPLHVLWLFLTVPWIGLKCVIVVLPDHTQSLIGHFIRVWYLSHNRAEKDQTRLHICTVSPEPLKIALKRWDVEEGSAIFYRPVQESLVLIAYMRAANP